MGKVPSASEYLAGFEKCRVKIKTRMKFLEEHYKSTDAQTKNKHTATMAELAQKVGYKNFNAANLHYGTLARIVSEAMNLKIDSLESPSFGWIHNLVTFDGESGPHWKLTMRPQVVEAWERFKKNTGK